MKTGFQGESGVGREALAWFVIIPLLPEAVRKGTYR